MNYKIYIFKALKLMNSPSYSLSFKQSFVYLFFVIVNFYYLVMLVLTFLILICILLNLCLLYKYGYYSFSLFCRCLTVIKTSYYNSNYIQQLTRDWFKFNASPLNEYWSLLLDILFLSKLFEAYLKY